MKGSLIKKVDVSGWAASAKGGVPSFTTPQGDIQLILSDVIKSTTRSISLLLNKIYSFYFSGMNQLFSNRKRTKISFGNFLLQVPKKCKNTINQWVSNLLHTAERRCFPTSLVGSTPPVDSSRPCFLTSPLSVLFAGTSCGDHIVRWLAVAVFSFNRFFPLIKWYHRIPELLSEQSWQKRIVTPNNYSWGSIQSFNDRLSLLTRQDLTGNGKKKPFGECPCGVTPTREKVSLLNTAPTKRFFGKGVVFHSPLDFSNIIRIPSNRIESRLVIHTPMKTTTLSLDQYFGLFQGSPSLEVGNFLWSIKSTLEQRVVRVVMLLWSFFLNVLSCCGGRQFLHLEFPPQGKLAAFPVVQQLTTFKIQEAGGRPILPIVSTEGIPQRTGKVSGLQQLESQPTSGRPDIPPLDISPVESDISTAHTWASYRVLLTTRKVYTAFIPPWLPVTSI